MKTGAGTPFQELFDEIDAQKRAWGEAAATFPADHAEYMNLPVEERMGLATRAFRAFTDHLSDRFSFPQERDKYRNAWIDPEDREDDGVINGYVGFVGEAPEAHGRRHPLLEVYAEAYAGAGSALHSEPVYLGSVRETPWGPGAEDSDNGLGWYVEGETADEAYELGSPEGQRVVEIVDKAMGSMFHRHIRAYRGYLGEHALAGAAQR